MSMFPHRPPIGQSLNTINDALDLIRNTNENNEKQIAHQAAELAAVRDKLYQLESLVLNKKNSDEEVVLLRRQLDALTRGGAAQPGMPAPPQHGGPPQQPPPPIAPSNGAFNGIMTGGSQVGLAPPPHPPPEQMPPQSQMSQGPPGLPAPPQQQPQQQPPQQLFQGQQQYAQPSSNGIGSQPPPTTASPGPGRRAIGRPAAVGPGTPQISNPIPFAQGAALSPQVNPTPDHARMASRVPMGNALCDVDPDHIPPLFKKQAADWFVIYNQHVNRVLDVDIVHTHEHSSVVCCVRFSHDGKLVATGCNRSAQIYDVQTGEKICVLQDESVEVGGDLYIRSVCFSPDGRYLATGAEDKLIRVWDIQSRLIRNKFSGHEQDIYSLDFARDGRTIASGSGDRTVRLWDIESGANTITLSIEDGVTTVAISPDTKYVAAGSLDKSVRVWDLHTGFLLERLEGVDGHKDSVYSVAFSPNGKDLVSGSLDKTIKMWELSAPRGGHSGQNPKNGRCVKTYEGHRDFVLSVALTPDAAWVMSGSKDRGVQFWDPRTGATQLMLQGHKNSVISVAPSPTGVYFATGSGDNKARIWTYRNIQGPI